MHNQPDTLGDVIKAAREKNGLTTAALAKLINVSERHIYRIENAGHKPSYQMLFNLIRELNISPDLIFYPEKDTWDTELEELIRLLYNCDRRSLEVVKATARALLDNAQEK